MDSDGWTILVRNYLPVDDRMEDRVRRVMADIDQFPDSALDVDHDKRTITIDCSQAEGWRDSIKDRVGVVHAGRHFVICPPWRTHEPASGEVVLDIDPGVAFGSGLHESTRLCLSILEGAVTPGCSVIDFGAGSGILAIAAAKLGAGRVVAIEGDEESSGVAAVNVKRNGVEGIVRVIWSDRPEAGEIVADIITANITPTVINENLPELVSVLRSGGTIVMSGMTVKNSHEVKDVLPQSGLALKNQVSEGDWVALVAVKPGSGVDR